MSCKHPTLNDNLSPLPRVGLFTSAKLQNKFIKKELFAKKYIKLSHSMFPIPYSLPSPHPSITKERRKILRLSYKNGVK